MYLKNKKIFEKLKKTGLSDFQEDIIRHELRLLKGRNSEKNAGKQQKEGMLYGNSDADLFLNKINKSFTLNLFTLDELLEKDKQREKDGFPRRIRIGKFIKPLKGKKEKIVVVPTTTEPKFYHDNSISEDDEESTGGAGEGEEGEVIGEQQAEPQEGEGEGQGAGQGEGGNHEIGSDAFDLGKIMTEKFDLPNLKVKGKKRSLTQFTYDLTDINRGFGQVLDKKATLKKIIETNILLNNINPDEPFSPENLIINPKDMIYRILSKEKDFEAQCVVFFIRDYSGSMQGAPTEAVVTQHLFIYSWLMYQFKNQVSVRFILHDTAAKEVPDFYTYYKSTIAGGTQIYPAYQMVADIIEKERLYIDNNIYIFHGTDGDDWEESGKQALEAVERILLRVNRMGITVAKNSWGSGDRKTIVEKYFEKSDLLNKKSSLIKLDGFLASDADESRLIESIKKLVE
ncbi:MAG: DUF444 family protein [Bacteroidales bacterium]|nr:DUF444 family protein [Bacteroidales bacterium]